MAFTKPSGFIKPSPIVRSAAKFKLIRELTRGSSFHPATIKYLAAYERLPLKESTRVIDAEYFWRMYGVAKDKLSYLRMVRAAFIYAAVRTLNGWEQ